MNANPLPIPEVEPLPKAGDDGVPYADYVRKIEFLDAHPPQPDEAPAHVLSAPILFDGVMAPANIAKEGITVDLGEGGTVVTMRVWHEDCQIGDESRPFLIGGRRVLTPVGAGWDWVPVDVERPDWITCSIYVAEVHCR